MGAALGTIGKFVMPMVQKAASNFLVSTVQNKVFGNSGTRTTANAGAFSSEQSVAGVQEASAVLVNKNSNNASIPLVYGHRRIGGTRVFVDTTDKAGSTSGTNYLNMAIVIAEGAEGGNGYPTKMYFDDKVVWDSTASGTLDYTVVNSSGTANNLATAQLKNFVGGGSTNFTGTDDEGETTDSEALIFWAPGNYGFNTVPSAWSTSIGSRWSTNHKLHGVTVAYVILEVNPDYYLGAVPTITFEMDGCKLSPVNASLVSTPTHSQYTSNFAHTNSEGANPVDVLYHYLTSPMTGKGLDFDLATSQYVPGQDIDLQSFKDARDWCDTNVTRNGQTYKRYVLNGIVHTSASLYDNMDMIVNSFNGMLIYTNGKYKLQIRKPNETSVFSADKNNILGDIELVFSGSDTKLNRLQVSYCNPDLEFSDDIINYFDSSYLTKDDNKILETKVDMPLITEPELINALAKYKVDTSRLAVTVNMTVPHTALVVECGEIIDITHDMFGWTAKKFRVLQQEILADNTIRLIATEYDSGIEIQ